MAIRVIENRDGSYQFKTDGEPQPDPVKACHLIAIHELDKAVIHRRAEVVCRDGYGSVCEQVMHSVACDIAKEKAEHWSGTAERYGRGLSHREIR